MNKLPNSNPQTDWRDYIEKSPLYARIAFSYELSLYNDFYYPLKQIQVYCPNCKKIQLFNRWNTVFQEGFSQVYHYNSFLLLYYNCVEDSCNYLKTYFVRVEHFNNQYYFTKCGEYPSLSPRIDEAILDAFPDEAELLKKAVCCLKDGFGVGAFAYLRQALEDRIDVFIAEIRKNAEEQGDTKVLQELDKLQNNSPASDKIKIARDALPVFLQVNGCNPLGLLYKNLSEGIHGLSDSECLGKANAIYGAMTFILKTLAENSASRKEYEASLKFLSK